MTHKRLDDVTTLNMFEIRPQNVLLQRHSDFWHNIDKY